MEANFRVLFLLRKDPVQRIQDWVAIECQIHPAIVDRFPNQASKDLTQRRWKQFLRSVKTVSCKDKFYPVNQCLRDGT